MADKNVCPTCMSSTAGAIQTRPSQPAEIARYLKAAIWLSIVLLAGCVGVLLTCRRIAGALSDPLSGLQLLITAIALLFLAAVLRRFAPGRMDSRAEFSLPGIAALLLL